MEHTIVCTHTILFDIKKTGLVPVSLHFCYVKLTIFSEIRNRKLATSLLDKFRKAEFNTYMKRKTLVTKTFFLLF